jgi:hypothetical protein
MDMRVHVIKSVRVGTRTGANSTLNLVRLTLT